MVRTKWHPVSKKISTHFKENVFVPTQGPDFGEWLEAETGGKIVQDFDDSDVWVNSLIVFADDRDYTAFMLKWG
jgi:hypothetical protein